MTQISIHIHVSVHAFSGASVQNLMALTGINRFLIYKYTTWNRFFQGPFAACSRVNLL